MENKVIKNLFSSAEINSILNNSIVKENKNRLQKTNTVKFTINVSEEIKNKIETALGVDLRNTTSIPMRWVKGDTLPHIDKGIKNFNKTHLIYLSNTNGSLIVDGKSYNIQAGNAHIFSEGLEHYTINTGTTERLMIGPMSESGFSVGTSSTIYFLDRLYSIGDIPNGIGYDSLNEDNPTITIFDFPPPGPIENEEYIITNIDNEEGPEPNWTPPPGKKFLGWKLLFGPPLGNNSVSKIYIPGEAYTYSDDQSIYLFPVWSNNVRLDLKGIEGTNRSEIISGNTLIRTKNNKKNKLSHTDILNIKKAKAMRRYD